MTSEAEKARKLLAAEYKANGYRCNFDGFSHGKDRAALRAIESALSLRGEVVEECARVAEHISRVFGEEPPGGERGTNIVWDTATRIATAIRSLANQESGNG